MNTPRAVELREVGAAMRASAKAAPDLGEFIRATEVSRVLNDFANRLEAALSAELARREGPVAVVQQGSLVWHPGYLMRSDKRLPDGTQLYLHPDLPTGLRSDDGWMPTELVKCDALSPVYVDGYNDALRLVREEYSTAPKAPEGWVMVPKRLTPGMFAAFMDAESTASAHEELQIAWDAMLAAAAPPSAGVGE